MTSDSMPRIVEDIKRDLLEYLVHSVRDNKPLENITYSGILDEINESQEKIDKALEELETEKVITSHDVTLKIYLPKTKEGKDVIKRLVEEEALPHSPYWLMAFSLLIFWVALPYLNMQLPSGFSDTTNLSAYLLGFKNAIMYSAIGGVVGANILKSASIKLKKIEFLSPKLYNNMNAVIKYTITLSFLCAIVLNVLERDYGFQLTNAALTYFIGSLAIAAGYVFARKEKSDDTWSLGSSSSSVLEKIHLGVKEWFTAFIFMFMWMPLISLGPADGLDAGFGCLRHCGLRDGVMTYMKLAERIRELRMAHRLDEKRDGR